MQRKRESTAGKSSIENPVIWKDGSQLLIASVWWKITHALWEPKCILNVCYLVCIHMHCDHGVYTNDIVKWYIIYIYHIHGYPILTFGFWNSFKESHVLVQFAGSVRYPRQWSSAGFIVASCHSGWFFPTSFLFASSWSQPQHLSEKYLLACLKNLFDMFDFFCTWKNFITPKPFWEE